MKIIWRSITKKDRVFDVLNNLKEERKENDELRILYKFLIYNKLNKDIVNKIIWILLEIEKIEISCIKKKNISKAITDLYQVIKKFDE